MEKLAQVMKLNVNKVGHQQQQQHRCEYNMQVIAKLIAIIVLFGFLLLMQRHFNVKTRPGKDNT